MEYFAKSKERILSVQEKSKLIQTVKTISQDLEAELSQIEKNVIANELARYNEDIIIEQKTLEEHEEDIVNCAFHFFEQYGEYFTRKEKQLIIEACRMHDWGKANVVFQNLVNPFFVPMKGKIQQIPHGFLSAITISRQEFLAMSELFQDEDFGPFITAIHYHHARTDELEDAEIKEYCEKFYAESIKEYLGKEKWKPYCSNRNKNTLLFRNNIYSNNDVPDSVRWNKYVLIKGLLNKFDYSVSSGHMEAEVNSDLDEKLLKCNVENALSDLGLRPAQEFMKENQNESLVIVAPTGSGKTEAALLWLNGEKGFYTLPLKVSSNAIYDRIREGYSYGQVSLLHSDSMSKYLEDYGDSEAGAYEQYEKAKLLSAPLTVCTVDQLFKFVYKALGTEIFAATLKYSKVVLDEIQAYSPRVIATIIYGLKTVLEMGGRFAIITATFPPVLQYFMARYGLIAGKQYKFRDFSSEVTLQRHIVEIRNSEIDTGEILEEGKSKKVLFICNTVTKAQEIYEKLSENAENVYLLHSRYIRKDRALLERMIMDFSKDKEMSGVWVTTQIVEASLDIDFDILYTEMSTADSLLQRMGRCNRRGRYVPKNSNIIVYTDENGVGDKSVYESVLYHRSLERLKNYEKVIFTESMKSDYMNQVYDTEEIKESKYYKEIERYLQHFDTLSPLEYSKEEADMEFRKIKSITVVPETVYEKYQDVFERCQKLLHTPHIGKDMKSMLNNKLNDMTLSLNLYGKFPDGVDVTVIGQKDGCRQSGIHRARLQYEFDTLSGRGRGLLLNVKEDEKFIL
ncbi:MAG: CRISPR-associated helicase Cas3' [Tyzzerella sp.]|nr:CRISPR-associated helicase Cas3' [Tyzzerella sp.]